MKARIALTKPEDVEITVAITLPLKDWKAIRDVISPAPYYTPAGRLEGVIRELIGKASAHFEASSDAER